MEPLTHEARRYCKGDDAWTEWQPCTEEQASRYLKDETFQVRQRVCRGRQYITNSLPMSTEERDAYWKRLERAGER